MPLILPGNVGSATAATGYNVANSLRFNDDSTDYLSRTPGSDGNRKTWTFSTWIKRGNIGIGNPINVFGGEDGASRYSDIMIGTPSGADDTFWFKQDTGTVAELRSTMKLRDTAAWYHLVFTYDSTDSTAADRMKMYVNGVRLTSFVTDTNAGENVDSYVNTSGDPNYIGIYQASSKKLDAYLCETVLIDGTALAADSFGEFDSDSGIWKPIDVSGLTFGTNGFYMEYKESGTGTDASGMGADTSGNTHHFAVNNLTAVDQSIDTCTNNFCTMNPLANFVTAATFTEGNLVTSFANGRGACTSTFGLTTGKWYVEMNITTMPKDERFGLGISPFETKAEDLPHEANNQGLDISGYNAVIYANLDDGSQVIDNFFGNNTTRFDSFTGIIGMALDLTSSTKTIAFSKAGAWVTGGGTSDTDFSNALEVDISTAFARHSVWHVASGTGNGDGTNGIFSMNFGSPAFAISSGNTDGNGYGNFEYAVPSGYFSLCTKNLAEYG